MENGNNESRESSEAILLLKIEQARNLADEAKTIAISAKRHECIKERELEQLTKAVEGTRDSMDKINDTNVLMIEELGRWKWFRIVMVPVTLLVLSAAATAFVSFVEIKNEVIRLKEKSNQAEEQLKNNVDAIEKVKSKQEKIADEISASGRLDGFQINDVRDIRSKLDQLINISKKKQRNRK
jgi:hypothetical protein